MRKLLIACLTSILFTSAFQLFAQEKLTLYYDQAGKGLDTKKKAVFYRLVSFDANNNPVGTVEDFYISGKPLRKGEATVIDKFDDSKSLWKGEVLSYDDRGKLSGKNNYDDDGNLDGIQTTVTPDGDRNEEFNYAHGNPVKDYYLVYDKKGGTTRYSYLTHLPMKLSTTDKKIVPFTARKIIYQDGQPVQFYFIDGLSVAVKISTKQQYGSYYEAFITIENGTNDQFNFDPSNITASIINDGKVYEGEVMTYDQYIKKVNRRQGWTAAFTAFAEFAAATSAGYSSSTTNAYARSSSGRSVSVNSKTTSYDGAAQYAATQNAANNVGQMLNAQYNIKQNISEGYIKLNTIFPNARLIGFMNIKFHDADHILVNVPVNGKVYHFEF